MILYAKVKKSDVKKLIQYIKEENIWIKNEKVISEGDYKLFPVKEKFELKGIKFEKREKEKDPSLNLPSFDTIGEIAIVEDRDEINLEEVSKNIMKVNKNIKRVYKKDGIHDTEFRIQPIEFVKGDKDNTVTEYKENKTKIKLDVKKTYFSPRLATERRKICETIKEGEKVLVQFSGVGPYVQEIAKNTKAKFVYGIELNPNAHKYSYENKFLNKNMNTLPIFGDVRKVMKNIKKHMFGLKSSIDKDQINKRIDKDYSIHELHLVYDDLFKQNEDIEKRGEKFKKTHNIKNLKKTIDLLKEKKKNVFLHMPIRKDNELINERKDYIKILSKLGKLAKEKSVGVIVHIHKNEDIEFILDRFERYKEYFYYETLMIAMNKSELFLKYKNKINNVCIDLSHIGLNEKNNESLKKEIKKLYKNFNIYYHLNNTEFNDKSKEGSLLKKGEMDIKLIQDYLTHGIVEVRNKDENNPKEMITSHNNLNDVFEKNRIFDRIVMPLPKDANTFLDHTIPYVKKGGIIHLYDFLEEENIPNETIKKFDEYAKKYKKDYKCLQVRKTGQYAPGKFRVCGDFKVIN